MTEKVKMKCLIGSIGLDFSIYSYGDIFEVEESLALDFERDQVAERVSEPIQEAKKKGKKEG